jgi:hypothetical protein
MLYTMNEMEDYDRQPFVARCPDFTPIVDDPAPHNFKIQNRAAAAAQDIFS